MEINFDLIKNARIALADYKDVIASATKGYGLSPLESTLVTFLCHNPKRNTPAEVIADLRLSKGNVSAAVASLKEKGYREVTSDPQDRRKSHLALLPASAPLCQSIEQARKRYFGKLLSGLSNDDLETLERCLLQMAANLEA